MNGLLKKISTGLIACMIAVMGVATVGVNTYAADTGSPCEGAKWTNNKLDVSDAKRPYECSACMGTKMAEGQTTEEAAFNKCGAADGVGIGDVWGWVYTIINWVLIAVGILCVVFIIIGGIRYATSGGDPEKVKSAKNTILYALIGLVIAILANVIVQIVFQVTGTVVTTS